MTATSIANSAITSLRAEVYELFKKLPQPVASATNAGAAPASNMAAAKPAPGVVPTTSASRVPDVVQVGSQLLRNT
jgi:hypothetical protein